MKRETAAAQKAFCETSLSLNVRSLRQSARLVNRQFAEIGDPRRRADSSLLLCRNRQTRNSRWKCPEFCCILTVYY